MRDKLKIRRVRHSLLLMGCTKHVVVGRQRNEEIAVAQRRQMYLLFLGGCSPLVCVHQPIFPAHLSIVLPGCDQCELCSSREGNRAGGRRYSRRYNSSKGITGGGSGV